MKDDFDHLFTFTLVPAAAVASYFLCTIGWRLARPGDQEPTEYYCVIIEDYCVIIVLLLYQVTI